MAVLVDQKHLAGAFDGATGQCHGLGRCCRLVEHGGVSNGHARQITHQGLEIHQGFHAALADLGLVGRVGRVPGRVLQNVAQDHAGGVGAVIPLADATFQQHVALGNPAQLFEGLGLGDGGGQLHALAARNAGGHDAFDQAAARGLANHRQHMRLVGLGQTDVAGFELAGILQFTQRCEARHQHGSFFQAVRAW